MSMKNANDNIENRTHDLSACDSVPRPTAPTPSPPPPCTGMNINRPILFFPELIEPRRAGTVAQFDAYCQVSESQPP